MGKLGSPQLDGHSGDESLYTRWGVVMEYAGREGSVVGSTSHDGSTSRHAGVNVELHWSPAILVYDDSAINGGEEMVKPGQVLPELRGADDIPYFRALPESV